MITKRTHSGLSSVEVRAFYLSPDNKDNLETARGQLIEIVTLISI